MHADRTILWILALGACTAPSEDKTDTTDSEGTETDTDGTTDETDPTDPTDPTDTETSTSPVVSCDRALNPLVIECTVTLEVAGAATLTLSAPGAPTRTFTDEAATTEHRMYGWGLKPETEYTWSLADASGTITTGSLPSELADLDIEVSGTLFGIDAVLVYAGCGWFAMIDSDGEVIWGAPTSVYDGIVDGMMWSQADRSVLTAKDSVMSFGASDFQEIHVSGAELLRLSPADFSLGLTHDVGRWGPYTYLLGEASGIGGFEVWEGTTYHGTYLLSDTFGGVPGLFTAHVNGLSVSDEGDVIVSVYGFDAVISVGGDPTSSEFLELQWLASGEPGGSDDLPGADYQPPSGTIFLKQHNASRHGDSLWVFDNQSHGDARALRMTMDHQSGLLTEDASWSLDQRCLNQGGATPIEGGVLATCANTGDVYAFREGASTPDWSLHASCGGFGGGGLSGSTRAYPVLVE